MTEHGSSARAAGPDRAQSMGTLAAFGAYGLWGLFPLYWKALKRVDPVQILCHRILWCAALTVILLVASRRLGSLAGIFRNARRALAVGASAILITANWGIYIWAVNSGHVTESSLGYYINPLLSVALGALLLREKLDRWTLAAVSIAALGVCVASVMLGRPPWISLALASSFALYGYVKKRAGLDPLSGLAAETLVASPFALAFLVLRGAAGQGAFGGSDAVVNVMLVLAGPVTAIPLLFFAAAANRITLTRMGFIQYLSPSLQLCLGLFVYGERLTLPMGVAIATVIGAVLVYASTRGAASSRA